ncbi:AAA family ATPase [Klebsiella sp. RHBSTW-00484]|uniref:NB-ARC domain-containing protein n=1 Tax=unclassified Klebsiella TaxID=2608929 RepID=UPI0015E5524A|nr:MULTISPECIES: NB-ARC domain-containing protein [unclassified Klebsiella]QLO37302.1 AAA family ATPase [Klebsiella sp. RHBSTW-00484]QLT76820.1 AAA family ATPase [Klebsiella sp. RHBSTW-00464]
MSNRNFATRMSCFSLVSAIETDLRSVIIGELPECYSEYLPTDVVKVAKERYLEHKKEVFSKDVDLLELLDFIDFYDLSKILHKITDIQTFSTKEDLKSIAFNLEKLSACRNRICHSRPLEPNDFSSLLDFSNELKNVGNVYDWKNIHIALKNLNNPSFALSLEIPSFWRVNTKNISNNLPLPEFDDTGFIGRDKDRKSITKLLNSNTKIISIVGEGGVGKTALAQRCLYDILELCELDDNKEPSFDIIVWVSLKTNRLTSNGSGQIKNAITNCSGLFQDIALNLSGVSNSSMEQDLEEILEYMEQFKVLLCIDNMETISSSEVRNFLAEIPNNSKVLITTRIGLGEIEYRYKLDKLDDKPSVELMRNMSRLLNLDKLYKKKSDALSDLCRILYNNPLLIKWYVLAVAAGSSNSELINKKTTNFQDALAFCFENLYDKLGDVEKEAISVIACIRKPVSAVELRFYLSDINEIKIEEALHQLHNSSMLISSEDKKSQGGQVYSLTGVAEEYINSIRPVSTETYKKVKDKRKELQVIVDEANVQKNHYNYDLNVIYWTTKDEKICSIYLKKALSEARKGDFASALSNVNQAKQLMPGFSECNRIHSFLLKDTSPFLAETEMEAAIDLNPLSVISRYAYAQFLISEDEFERANEQIDEALKIDSEDIALKTCKAWILTLMGDYKNASSLYEELIPLQSSRHRKFRISTYDQASSCYRRMTEILFKDHDYLEAKKSLQRSMEIIEQAVNSGDYDHGTINKLMDILDSALIFSNKTDDKSIIEDIISFIAANSETLNVRSIQALRKGLEIFIKSCDSKTEKEIDKILNSLISGSKEISSERVLGTIENTVSTGRGVSYGFLTDIDNVKYFFPRSELVPKDLLDIESSQMNVTFIPGESERGKCAFSIRKRD